MSLIDIDSDSDGESSDTLEPAINSTATNSSRRSLDDLNSTIPYGSEIYSQYIHRQRRDEVFRRNHELLSSSVSRTQEFSREEMVADYEKRLRRRNLRSHKRAEQLARHLSWKDVLNSDLVDEFNIMNDIDRILNDEKSQSNPDLIEVGGCMLRLAMWPTDLLWEYVNEVIESHKLDLIRRGLTKHHDHESEWENLVSLHFRCGDNGYIQGKESELACMHSVSTVVKDTVTGKEETVWNIPPHDEVSRLTTQYVVY